MKVLVLVAIFATLVSVQGKHKKNDWHEHDQSLMKEKLGLLKEETNTIDHGHAPYKTKHNGKGKKFHHFGHRDEQHWRGKQGSDGEHKKSRHDLDDIRLQELDHHTTPKQKNPKKELSKHLLGREEKHSMKKIENNAPKTKKAKFLKKKALKNALKKALKSGKLPQDVAEKCSGTNPEKYQKKSCMKYFKKYFFNQKKMKKNANLSP